jgi:hypothetical protein
MAALFLFACGSGSEDAPGPGPGPTPDAGPDGGPLFVGDHLPVPEKEPETPIGAPHDQTVSYPDGSQWSCTVQHYSMKDDPDAFVTLNPTAAVVWPGSLVQGKSLAGGSPEPIAIKRAGGTILLNLVNSGGGAVAKTYQAKLDEITQGNVVDAQNQILSNNVGSTPAAFSFEFQKVESETQLALDMSANESWLTGSAKESLKFAQDKHYTRYLVKLTQQYYTMVFQTPTSPDGLVAPDVTAAEVAKYVGPGNPATYISSVTYGRQFYLLFESTASTQDLETALSFVYNGVAVNADAEAKQRYQDAEAATTVKAWALGGATDDALDAALGASENKFDKLHDYIVKGANFDAAHPGLPLSYVVRYADDNSTVRVALAGEYDKAQCLPVVQNDARSVLWLDATNVSLGAGPITTWKGKTPNSNDGRNGTSALFIPTGFNGHPGVYFSRQNGTHFDVDLGSGYVVDTDYTVMAAFQIPAATSLAGQGVILLAGKGNATNGDLHFGWLDASTFRFGQYNNDIDANMAPSGSGNVVTLRFSQKDGHAIYQDGVKRASNTEKTPLGSNPGGTLGYSGWTSGFEGYLGEMRVLSYALSDAERLTIECAMGAKWGVGVAGCVNGKPDPTKLSF